MMSVLRCVRSPYLLGHCDCNSKVMMSVLRCVRSPYLLGQSDCNSKVMMSVLRCVSSYSGLVHFARISR